MGELHNIYTDSACNYIVHAHNALGKLMNGRPMTLNRMIIVMAGILVLVALMGTASATNYYLATWGDNSNYGTSLETAWATPSYAVRQLYAGDTLWVVDGIYYDSDTSELKEVNVGNENNWVRIKAYNGTPIWDGGGTYTTGFEIFHSPTPYSPCYVELDGIHIRNYGYAEIKLRNLQNVIIKNCKFTNSSVALPTWTSLMEIGPGVRDITVDNCSFIDTGNFGIDLMGDRYGTDLKTYDVSVTNCYFEKTVNHGAMQISDYASDINVIGNTFVDCYCGVDTYFHELETNNNRQSNIIVKDNVFTDMDNYGIYFMATINSLAENNILEGSGGSAFCIHGYSNNITIKDNTISDVDMLYDDYEGQYSNIFVNYERNTYTGLDSSTTYYARAGGTLVIKDDFHQPSFMVYLGNVERSGTAIVEYTDGRVFDYILSGSDYSVTYPSWYPDMSNFVMESSNAVSVVIMPYNLTLRPTYGHLHDVTVDIWDEETDTYRITASSTESENPTWINLTTQAASATYNIKRDGKSCAPATTGADGVLRYRHTGAWDGLHTFEFSYASGGVDPVPCVTNIRSDTPTQNTVTLRWDYSAPDIDYYTIYKNGILLDTTESQYYSATNLVPDTTYTFDVSATKDDITSDSVNIIVKTEAEEVDPVPCVTNIRSDTPTQNTITLRWDHSAPDIDYYTINKDGVLLDTTASQYYSATNLVPDTTYTFDVSATKDGITSDSINIIVKTEAEDIGSNLVIIDNYAAAYPERSVAVPIMIHGATEVACYGLNLTYDARVVTVTGVTQGDFTTYFGFDDASATDGWVTVNTYVSETSLNGDVKIADVTLKAVGTAGDTSPLDMEIMSVADQNGYPVSGTVSNGLFTVVSDASPPVVTDPSASQLIPDDTDGVPSWGETATLNVTVTDESGIAGVTIDLSAIGGSPVQPMTNIGNDIWSVTTNASAGTPPQTYDLAVCATDIHGYTNMSESVELVVMRNGDVTGDDDVTPEDVALLANYVTYPGRYTISSEFVADVTDDGVVNIADAMLLANYVASPDRRTLRFVGGTC